MSYWKQAQNTRNQNTSFKQLFELCTRPVATLAMPFLAFSYHPGRDGMPGWTLRVLRI